MSSTLNLWSRNANETAAEAARDCVDKDRYVEDLTFIADVRAPGSTHWQEVQDLCADRLTDLGYEVDLFEYGSGVNVVGRLGVLNGEFT